ncbi:MAG: DUF3823 domain-containing protein [Dysgonamonadaceae bacterium]|jgi:hypothetical protein|nr:DUF3823 domain-containing protein [Dysgonamonadaceae bacterium]
MKKKRILSLACLFAVILFSSCEIDNYDEPDGILTGRIIDAITGNPVLTEQPQGFRIRYEEISWSETPTAQFFWGKADGTFNNNKLFTGKYRITPVEGAFVTPDPKETDVSSGKTATVDFTVTPYISFSNVSIVKEGNSVRATFTMSRNVESAALQDYRVFATAAAPYVGTQLFDNDVSTVAVGINESNLDVPVSVLLPENFVSGKTYYIRVGARCQNSSSRYNMTEAVKIQM